MPQIMCVDVNFEVLLARWCARLALLYVLAPAFISATITRCSRHIS